MAHSHTLTTAHMPCAVITSPLQLIDNEDLWGGSLLGSIIFRDASQTFSLSQALR